MGRALLAIEHARDRLASRHHALAHLGGGIRQQRLDGLGRSLRHATRLCPYGGKRSSDLRHLRTPHMRSSQPAASTALVCSAQSGAAIPFVPTVRAEMHDFATFLTIFGFFHQSRWASHPAGRRVEGCTLDEPVHPSCHQRHVGAHAHRRARDNPGGRIPDQRPRLHGRRGRGGEGLSDGRTRGRPCADAAASFELR